MFLGLKDVPSSYPAMWYANTHHRLALLSRPSTAKIAWLYDTLDTSTFRYRVFNMVENINADARAAGTWFYSSEIDVLSERLGDLDTLIVCRMRYSLAVVSLIARAKNAGVRVLFDCDDLVFDNRFIHLVMHTLDVDPSHAGFDWWFAYVGRIGGVAQLCDGAIASTPVLAERMKDFLNNDDVSIVPNFLNRTQQEISAQILEMKRQEDFARDGRISIGYFSGTPSHNRDFAIAAPAIKRLMEADKDLHLRVVGYIDGLDMFEELKGRLELVPLQDWTSLQKIIGEVEINIAPLQENVFTNCKSVLKFFEAAIVGTWTIASPTKPFINAIKNTSTGVLAQSHEWESSILEAIELFRSQKFANYLETAAADANAAYRWDGFADDILRAALRNI